MKTTITKLVGTYQSDDDVIKKYNLQNNPEYFIQNILSGAEVVKEMAKQKHPKEYKQLTEWSVRFDNMFDVTNTINSEPITELFYLSEYIKECENDGYNYTGNVMFLPERFLRLMAQRFMIDTRGQKKNTRTPGSGSKLTKPKKKRK